MSAEAPFVVGKPVTGEYFIIHLVVVTTVLYAACIHYNLGVYGD
jgi:hypothetical protein